jgi:hypothetical protein
MHHQTQKIEKIILDKGEHFMQVAFSNQFSFDSFFVREFVTDNENLGEEIVDRILNIFPNASIISAEKHQTVWLFNGRRFWEVCFIVNELKEKRGLTKMDIIRIVGEEK